MPVMSTAPVVGKYCPKKPGEEEHWPLARFELPVRLEACEFVVVSRYTRVPTRATTLYGAAGASPFPAWISPGPKQSADAKKTVLND